MQPYEERRSIAVLKLEGPDLCASRRELHQALLVVSVTVVSVDVEAVVVDADADRHSPNVCLLRSRISVRRRTSE